MLKPFTLILFMGLFLDGISQVQPYTAWNNAAISYSVDHNGLSHLLIKEGQSNTWECTASKTDLLTWLVKTGLDSVLTGKLSPRDSLLRAYPPGNAQHRFMSGTSYDSIHDILTVMEYNAMAFSSTSYTFDAEGRILKINSSYGGEVAGSGGSSEIQYVYNFQKHTVHSNISRQTAYRGSEVDTGQDETCWDETNTYPLSETLTDPDTGILASYEYHYRFHCLHEARVTTTENGKKQTRTYTYHFSR